MYSFAMRAWEDHCHKFNTCGGMLFFSDWEYASAQIYMLDFAIKNPAFFIPALFTKSTGTWHYLLKVSALTTIC
jgi:hypothetical protein